MEINKARTIGRANGSVRSAHTRTALRRWSDGVTPDGAAARGEAPIVFYLVQADVRPPPTQNQATGLPGEGPVLSAPWAEAVGHWERPAAGPHGRIASNPSLQHDAWRCTLAIDCPARLNVACRGTIQRWCIQSIVKSQNAPVDSMSGMRWLPLIRLGVAHSHQGLNGCDANGGPSLGQLP
jgi:hypothetical protein